MKKFKTLGYVLSLALGMTMLTGCGKKVDGVDQQSMIDKYAAYCDLPDYISGANLSKYLIAESRKGGKVGVFLKPCDSYSFVQLLKEHRILRENVYAVGVQCDGMCDMEKIKEAGLAGVTAVDY